VVAPSTPHCLADVGTGAWWRKVLWQSLVVVWLHGFSGESHNRFRLVSATTVQCCIVLLVEGVAVRIATSRNSPGENRRTDLQVQAAVASLRRFPLDVLFWSSWNDDIRSIWRVRGAREHKKQLVEWS